MNIKNLGIKLYITALLINLIPFLFLLLTIIVTNMFDMEISDEGILGGLSFLMMSLLFVTPFIGVVLVILGFVVRIFEAKKKTNE